MPQPYLLITGICSEMFVLGGTEWKYLIGARSTQVLWGESG